MKFRELHLGKAISAALFVLLLTVAGTKNALAQTQVATLQHGQEISAFYGSNALVEAYNAADNGDIITLSSGSFTPTNINKGITLRGAGCVSDSVAGTNATIINGGFTLWVVDTIENRMNIEGILFPNTVNMGNLNSPTFTRCNFMNISEPGNGVMEGAQFIDCIIGAMTFYRANNTTFNNCVVWEPNWVQNSHIVVIYNSIFGGMVNGSSTLTAYNSIIVKQRGGDPTSSCSFFNCIGIYLEEEGTAFGSGYTSNCTQYMGYESVFNTFDGTFHPEADFSLNEDAASFEGTDGTQVGIFGGSMPYNSRPAYQVLKRSTVAPRSTVDGKLNVDIEVITEEE